MSIIVISDELCNICSRKTSLFETDNVLSIVAVFISGITFLLYLFQTYRELFTLYWFSDYDVIFIPVDSDETRKPFEFVNNYKEEFSKDIHVCKFKHQWVGDLKTVYYYQSFGEFVSNLDDYPYRQLFLKSDEHKYFSKVVKTHKFKKELRKRLNGRV